MTQRNVEIVIGRLVTDDQFRQLFLDDPQGSLIELLDRGTHLSQCEIDALVSTDLQLWRDIAGRVDRRLQKARLDGKGD